MELRAAGGWRTEVKLIGREGHSREPDQVVSHPQAPGVGQPIDRGEIHVADEAHSAFAGRLAGAFLELDDRVVDGRLRLAHRRTGERHLRPALEGPAVPGHSPTAAELHAREIGRGVEGVESGSGVAAGRKREGRRFIQSGPAESHEPVERALAVVVAPPPRLARPPVVAAVAGPEKQVGFRRIERRGVCGPCEVRAIQNAVRGSQRIGCLEGACVGGIRIGEHAPDAEIPHLPAGAFFPDMAIKKPHAWLD